jgi:IS30 family transposase
MPPLYPDAPTEQSYHHLTLSERAQIEALIAAKLGNPRIAELVGVHRSTIWRERKRLAKDYNAKKANTQAKTRRRPSNGRAELLECPGGQALLEELLIAMRDDRRSISQALVLLAARIRELGVRATPRLVYRWIRRRWKSTWLARQLAQAMIRPPGHRRPRGGPRRTTIPGLVGIEHRPREAETRQVPGHFEGDLVKGAHSGTTLITLVDRASRLTRILWVPSGQSDDVTRALVEWATTSGDVVQTVTWDRGSEMVRHAEFTQATGVPIYFCPPQSPWMRGTNENTNGVLRRYWPKGTDLPCDQAEIERVEGLVNSRPMPTLSWGTPEEVHARLTV